MKESFHNIQNIDLDAYAKDFLRTLSNFCSKCPLQPCIRYVDSLGKVYIEWGTDESLSFELDPLKEKKDTIKDIKMKLQESYPVLYTKKVTMLSAKEIEKMVDNGMPLSEALEQSNTEYIPKYKIMRVHHSYNEFDCLDMNTKQLYKFRTKLPVTAILEELRKNPKDNESLLDNFVLLYRITNEKEREKEQTPHEV